MRNLLKNNLKILAALFIVALFFVSSCSEPAPNQIMEEGPEIEKEVLQDSIDEPDELILEKEKEEPVLEKTNQDLIKKTPETNKPPETKESTTTTIKQRETLEEEVVIAEAKPHEQPAEEKALEQKAAHQGTLRVHFIDVGQGDSILIQLPSGANILIDGGTKSAGNRVVSYIRGLGISKINIVIGTHPHADHIGGLIAVLNNFTVDYVFDSGVAHTTQTYQEYLNAIFSKNINYITPEAGERFDLQSGAYLEIMGPIIRNEKDLNNSSIVVKLIHGHVSFLFTLLSSI